MVLTDRLRQLATVAVTFVVRRVDRNKMFMRMVKTVAAVCILMFIVIPIILKTNTWIHPNIVFLNMVRWPPHRVFDIPEDFGLHGARNLYLQHDQVSLGVWHILPSSLSEHHEKIDDATFDQFLSSGNPIFLYFHGNAGSRAGWHRVQLYKLLAQIGVHVFAIDYRGYADSTGIPSEEGVCADAIYLYHWVKKRKGNSPLFVWGHSLGTAITTKVVKLLAEEGDYPVGVVLEAPFNNILEAASSHPLAKPFVVMPWFSWAFLDPITENNIHFVSDKNIAGVKSPLLIMHSRDDGVVPFELGYKLYQAAKESRPDGHPPLKFVEFNDTSGYGHKYMYQAPEMTDLIKDFIAEALTMDQIS